MAKMGFEPRRRTYQDHNYKTETRSYRVDCYLGERVYTLRSLREQRFARLLECLIETQSVLRWWYEPHAFNCGTYYRKERIYTPDFLITLGDDDIFDTGTRSVWVEVKATLDQKAVSRCRWLRKKYPHIALCLMMDRDYRAITKPSKARTRQVVLQAKLRPHVDRTLFANEWYKPFGIK